jgi:hypothetical protein
MSHLQRCLVAKFTGAPDAATACLEAVADYRTARDLEPESLWPRLLLSRACSLAGLHAEALTEGEAMVAMRTFEIDAMGRTNAVLVQAQVLGRSGRIEEAVDLVEQLLAMPSHLSPARLRIDPEWASLRHHPRIEEIIRADTPSQVDQGASVDSSG